MKTTYFLFRMRKSYSIFVWTLEVHRCNQAMQYCKVPFWERFEQCMFVRNNTVCVYRAKQREQATQLTPVHAVLILLYVPKNSQHVRAQCSRPCMRTVQNSRVAWKAPLWDRAKWARISQKQLATLLRKSHAASENMVMNFSYIFAFNCSYSVVTNH